MTKRVLTGLIASFLIFGTLLPTGTFADEVNTDRVNGDHTQKEFKNPFVEKTPEEKEAIRQETIDLYAPDMADEFNALKQDHDEIHVDLAELKEDLKVEKEANQAIFRENVKAYIDDLKAQIESEEITREEAAETFEVYTENVKVDREALKINKEEFEALRAEFEANKESRLAKRSEINEAVKADDADAVYEALQEILPLYEEHLALDELKLSYYNEQLETLINN